MSSTLVARATEAKGKRLPDALKFALRKKYGDPIDAVLCAGNLDYLQALVDLNLDGADVLLEYVIRVKEVRIKEEW